MVRGISSMKNYALYAAPALVAVLLVVPQLPAKAEDAAHAYFNALVARSDHWKSASLRSESQLGAPRSGGYAASNSGPYWVTYSPLTDRDPHRQDAAKAVIEPWQDMTEVMVAPLSAVDQWIRLSSASGDVTKVSTSFNSERQLKLGSEIMMIERPPAPCAASNLTCSPLDRTTGLLRVKRGQYGTTALPHAVNEGPLLLSNNSLRKQIRIPLGTSNGNTYLFTWDTYYTSSYLNTGLLNHKSFQFASNSLWLEPQTQFHGRNAACFNSSTHVASVDVRSYAKDGVGGDPDWRRTTGNQLGPGTVDNQPLRPQAGEFCIAANRWTRWWVRIEQRADDYDYMDFWMADEGTAPVHLFKRIPLSVEPDSKPIPDSITEWWIELNTSTDELPAGRTHDFRDLVVYVRNFVALLNPPSDVNPFLLRPVPGGPLPPPLVGPAPPKNVRIGG